MKFITDFPTESHVQTANNMQQKTGELKVSFNQYAKCHDYNQFDQCMQYTYFYGTINGKIGPVRFEMVELGSE